MPLVKVNINKADYITWLKVKADLGNGRRITNAEALNQLVEHFNRDRVRRII